jgi:hypothetical protein
VSCFVVKVLELHHPYRKVKCFNCLLVSPCGVNAGYHHDSHILDVDRHFEERIGVRPGEEGVAKGRSAWDMLRANRSGRTTE